MFPEYTTWATIVRVALLPFDRLPIFQVPSLYSPRLGVLEIIFKWLSSSSSTITPVALQGPSLTTVIMNFILSSTLITSLVSLISLVMRKSVNGTAVKLCAEATLFDILMSFPSPVTQTVLVIGPMWITSAMIVSVSKSSTSNSPIYQ